MPSYSTGTLRACEGSIQPKQEGMVVREGFLEEVTFSPVPEMKRHLSAKS